MREIRILIKINEKTNKICVVEEEILGISPGIDKELYLQGVYNHLLQNKSRSLKEKNRVKI